MRRSLTIAYDRREKQPLISLDGKICGSRCITYAPATLSTFDYCVAGDWEVTNGETVVPCWALEWKSCADFIGSWMLRDRKLHELEKINRAKLWGLPIIYVTDADQRNLGAYDYSRFPSGQVNAMVMQSVIDNMRYNGVQVIQCRDRIVAEYVIVSLLKRRADAIQREISRQERIARIMQRARKEKDASDNSQRQVANS